MHRFSPGVLPSRVMINVNELVPFNPIFLDARCISRGICHSKISQMKKYLEDYQRQPLQCQCKVYKLCSFVSNCFIVLSQFMFTIQDFSILVLQNAQCLCQEKAQINVRPSSDDDTFSYKTIKTKVNFLMATLFGEITIVDNGGTRAAIRSSKSNLAARRCSQQPSIHPPRRTKPVAHLHTLSYGQWHFVHVEYKEI